MSHKLPIGSMNTTTVVVFIVGRWLGIFAVPAGGKGGVGCTVKKEMKCSGDSASAN